MHDILTPYKRIASVSDVHLGSLGCQRQAFSDFLRVLDVEYLIIVGDLLDSLDESRLTPEDFAILQQIRELPMRVLVLPGNHDPDEQVLARLTGRDTGFNTYVNCGRTCTYFEHGSAFDWAADFGFITRWGDAIGEFLHKISHHGAAEADKVFCKFITGCYHNVHKGMLQRMRINDCNRAVAGHTHRMEHHVDGYYNDGSWAIQNPTYMINENGVIEIRRWDGSKP
jgi:UDP-2,3-diacylglucosamine pyrophosphatase LpxH